MQGEMLKSVVENVHRATEVMFSQTAREIPIRARQHRDAIETPREHQRLVARAIEVGAHAGGVPHNDYAVLCAAPGIPTAQDRRTLPNACKMRGNRTRERRLCTSAYCEVPDADDRTGKAPPALRMCRVVLAAMASDGRVEGRQRIHEVSGLLQDGLSMPNTPC
jgi:hypothetical protein